MRKRSSGVLMHISSLPGKFGIGSVGEEAYNFIDFLVKSGQKYWQILPLGHTSYGDSPYQCFSAFAGNPHFIDLDILKDEGYLNEEDYINENFGVNEEKVDFGLIFEVRNRILKIAYKNFKKNKLNRHREFEYRQFKEKSKFWLEDYSAYMAIKDKFNLVAWREWDEDIKNREDEVLNKYKEELKDEIEYYKFIQFIFFKQWQELKQYANYNGISIIGDIPIYVADDSADMWSNPSLFKVDGNNVPKVVAGCPPDAFSVTGQLWGNPIYDWEAMEKEEYKWWISRIEESLKLYDMVRIDHFRGFESYWEIPYGDDTAINGRWVKGPAMKLFDAIKSNLGDVNIIAEDLGFMTDEVIEFRNKTGFPGMKVLQFGFGGEDSTDLPHNYINNSIAYTGTHDNDTVLGWFESVATEEEREKSLKYLNINSLDNSYSFIRSVLGSVSFLSIVTMQDLLNLGSEARMNIPSVFGGNWEWRVKKDKITEKLAEELYDLTKLYGRI